MAQFRMHGKVPGKFPLWRYQEICRSSAYRISPSITQQTRIDLDFSECFFPQLKMS